MLCMYYVCMRVLYACLLLIIIFILMNFHCKNLTNVLQTLSFFHLLMFMDKFCCIYCKALEYFVYFFSILYYVC